MKKILLRKEREDQEERLKQLKIQNEHPQEQLTIAQSSSKKSTNSFESEQEKQPSALSQKNKFFSSLIESLSLKNTSDTPNKLPSSKATRHTSKADEHQEFENEVSLERSRNNDEQLASSLEHNAFMYTDFYGRELNTNNDNNNNNNDNNNTAPKIPIEIATDFKEIKKLIRNDLYFKYHSYNTKKHLLNHTNGLINHHSKHFHNTSTNNFVYPFDPLAASKEMHDPHRMVLGKRGPNSPLQVPITPTSFNLHMLSSQPHYSKGTTQGGHYLFMVPHHMSRSDWEGPGAQESGKNAKQHHNKHTSHDVNSQLKKQNQQQQQKYQQQQQQHQQQHHQQHQQQQHQQHHPHQHHQQQKHQQLHESHHKQSSLDDFHKQQQQQIQPLQQCFNEEYNTFSVSKTSTTTTNTTSSDSQTDKAIFLQTSPMKYTTPHHQRQSSSVESLNNINIYNNNTFNRMKVTASISDSHVKEGLSESYSISSILNNNNNNNNNNNKKHDEIKATTTKTFSVHNNLNASSTTSTVQRNSSNEGDQVLNNENQSNKHHMKLEGDNGTSTAEGNRPFHGSYLDRLAPEGLSDNLIRGKGRSAKNAAQQNSSSLGRPIIKCLVCAKLFNNSSALAKHKLTHSDERRYTCTLCSKAFKRQDHLNGHMMTHSSKKPFECKFANCCKSYCDARSLKRHLENFHQARTAYESEATVEARQVKSVLSENTPSNSFEAALDVWAPGFNPFDEPKPIKCTVCQRAFRNVPALNGHMRLHGGYTNRDLLDEDVPKVSREDSGEECTAQEHLINVLLFEGPVKETSIHGSAARNVSSRKSDEGRHVVQCKKSSSLEMERPASMVGAGKGSDEERSSYEEMLKRREVELRYLRIRDVTEASLDTKNWESNTNSISCQESIQHVSTNSHHNEAKQQVCQWNEKDSTERVLSTCLKESLLYRRRLRKNSEKTANSGRSSCEESHGKSDAEVCRLNRTVSSGFESHQTRGTYGFKHAYTSEDTSNGNEVSYTEVGMDGDANEAINLSRHQRLDIGEESNASMTSQSAGDFGIASETLLSTSVASQNSQSDHTMVFPNESINRSQRLTALADELKTDAKRVDSRVEVMRLHKSNEASSQASRLGAECSSIDNIALIANTSKTESFNPNHHKTNPNLDSNLDPNPPKSERKSTSSLPCTPFTAHTPYTPRTSDRQSPRQANHFEFPPSASEASEASEAPFYQSTSHLNEAFTARRAWARSDWKHEWGSGAQTDVPGNAEHFHSGIETARVPETAIESSASNLFQTSAMLSSGKAAKKNCASPSKTQWNREDANPDPITKPSPVRNPAPHLDPIPVLTPQLDARFLAASLAHHNIPQTPSSTFVKPLKHSFSSSQRGVHTTTSPPSLSPEPSAHETSHPPPTHPLHHTSSLSSGSSSRNNDNYLHNNDTSIGNHCNSFNNEFYNSNLSVYSLPRRNIEDLYKAVIPDVEGCRGGAEWRGEDVQRTKRREAATNPRVTDIPRVTDNPPVTEIPRVTDIPRVTEIPRVTDIPRDTDIPRVTDIPRYREASTTQDSARNKVDRRLPTPS